MGREVKMETDLAIEWEIGAEIGREVQPEIGSVIVLFIGRGRWISRIDSPMDRRIDAARSLRHAMKLRPLHATHRPLHADLGRRETRAALALVEAQGTAKRSSALAQIVQIAEIAEIATSALGLTHRASGSAFQASDNFRSEMSPARREWR